MINKQIIEYINKRRQKYIIISGLRIQTIRYACIVLYGIYFNFKQKELGYATY